MRWLPGIAMLPLDVARGTARFAHDVAAIAAVAREVEPELRGRAATARESTNEALALVRENNDLTKRTNALLAAVDAGATELLRVLAELQRDMPALTDSAETISDAAPPVQAAAERMERLASRIPGIRDARR
jgi:ABC-type transporter Mla subunit MlaD